MDNTLPLPLVRPQPDIDGTLPLPLGGLPENAPAPKPRRPRFAAAEFAAAHGASTPVALCQSQRSETVSLHRQTFGATGGSRTLAACQSGQSRTTARLHACTTNASGKTAALAGCLNAPVAATAFLHTCQNGRHGASRLHQGAAAVSVSAHALLRGCADTRHGASSLLALLLNGAASGSLIASCRNVPHGSSVQPPCEWYPLPPPLVPDTAAPAPCGRPPSAKRLPLPMRHPQTAHSPRSLPLPLNCFYIPTVPNRESYTVTNHITARINGQPVECLSAHVQADRNGYCWQGGIGIAPQDFAKFDWDAPRDTPMTLEIAINGETFILLAEEYGDSRTFGQKTYTVGGRSPSALLGADYAKWQSGGNSRALDASQLAIAQTKPFGFKLDWRLPDWRIPAEVYRLDDKTPIGVLQDIAQALGAFVATDPQGQTLRLAPRWPQAAWRIAQAAPDVSVPDSLILQINGQKQTSARANGVFVLADHAHGRGADVYRKGTDREPRAALISHPLYTDTKPCYAAGIAALSDSGVHKRETLTVPLAPKYGLRRAELGQIWRIDEGGLSWAGVADGVDIRAALDGNGALSVVQTVQLDRYLGD